MGKQSILSLSLLSLFLYKSLFSHECGGTKPFICSDRTCVDNYDECEPFNGCLIASKPFLCSNGSCALNYTFCEEKFFKCEDNTLKKCIDGICRDDCSKIKHSSCPFKKGYRCPDGKCVKQLIECGCKFYNKLLDVPTMYHFTALIRNVSLITPLVNFRTSSEL